MKGLADIVTANKKATKFDARGFAKKMTTPIKVTRPDKVNYSRKGKKVTEEIAAPTNAMGVSSTSSGLVQTYDPLLRRKKVLSRIKMIVKNANDKRRLRQ
jgi:hypothetical protein